ncbi:MAG: DUF2490 domain-containing protein [Lentimicrobium sp.]
MSFSKTINSLAATFVLSILFGIIAKAQDRVFLTAFPGISMTVPVSREIDLITSSSLQYNVAEKSYNDIDFPATVNYYDFQAGAVYKYTQILHFAAAWYYRHSDPERINSAVENRLWQQVSTTGMVNNLRIRNRFRLEQRFISANGKTAPVRWRFRYLAGLEIPLQGEKTDVGEFYFTASNEVYLSLNTPRPSVYSENWVTALAGYRISQKNRIEAGPAWQIQVRNQAGDINHSIHFQVNLLLNLNFEKYKTKK